MTQQWVRGYHLPTSLLSTAMIFNGEPPKHWHWMLLAQCGSSGSLGRNNEKDICTLVLKMGLVIVLAPHIRQTWSYLKVNKIRPTNRLKAKPLWGCSGFSSSLIFNVPVRLNEVIDRRSLLVHSKTLDCQQFCVHSVSSCPNSHWRLPYCTTYFSKNISSMSMCKNLFLWLWGAVGRGDNTEGPGVVLAQDKRTWVTYSGALSPFALSYVPLSGNVHPESKAFYLLLCQVSFKS